MTAQILISELTTLIQESKRKNLELKQAAESSLQEIKGLQQTSEKQIAADLSRRSQFINPFLIACSSKNAKFATTGMSCIQRLAVSQALPKSRLKDVVEAMTECTTLGLDIQLKILQTLPSLLQNYADQVSGNSLFTVLQICSTLQSSKTSTVSSTSAATLQQLIASLYEKLVVEDKRLLEVPTIAEVPIGDKHVPVRSVAHDAFRIFHDLCLLAEGSKPRYIRFSPTPETVLLELIESIFTGYGSVIKAHPEQAHLVKTVLIPYLIKSFSEKSTFPITVRATRLLYLVVKHFIDIFPEESETILQWFNHCLDPDATTLWKRILCMEVFREIFADSHLTLQVHAQFNGKNERKAIIPDCLASFVRLASEKPALIGLGQQSTVPIGHYFQRDTVAESVDQSSSSVLGSSAGVPTSAVPGISAQFSAIKAPCIEQLDKQEPPNAPETYIYSLVLGALNNLSESLAKFVLPLTVAATEKSKRRQRPAISEEDRETAVEESDLPPSEGQSTSERQQLQKRVPINPLTLKDHKLYDEIQTAAHLIDQSWPAILACCSTFFNAALDSDAYRSLVRSFQKFTQVAGLLDMTVPRDAFLTTLGKSAMPPNLLTAGITSAGSQPPPTPSFLSNAKGLLNVESIVNQATSFLPDRRRASIDSGEPSLNVRNLLCLRALLNLAIALGPTLEGSWSIIFETLQQADRVLASAGGRSFQSPQSSTNPEGSHAQQIATEVTAVQAAASRLFESTAEFPDQAFLFVLESLCGLVEIKGLKPVPSASPPVTSPQSPGQHRRIASFSGLSVKTGVNDHDYLFNLTKLRELASLNLERFVTTDNEESSGWVLLLDHLINLATSHVVTSNARLLAVDIIRQLVLDSILYPLRVGEEQESRIQSRALVPLSKLSAILRRDSSSASNPDDTAIEGHIVVLETLRALLEHTGEALLSGWPAVFDVIKSSFVEESNRRGAESTVESIRLDLISVKLGRSAFSSLQLICSDFLSPSLKSSMSTLIDLLYHFASQQQDLNISLTTTTFFWNVSDFLYAALSHHALERLATQNDLKFHELNEEKFKSMQKSEDFTTIIWLYLLKRLTDLISDPRHEVRNGAVQTILRIFDSHGDDLSPTMWQLCLDSILLLMLTTDVKTYYGHLQSDDDIENEEDASIVRNKIGTSQVLLQGFSKLLADYLESIHKSTGFSIFWESLTDTFLKYLDCNLHDVAAAVYLAIDVILSKASKLSKFDSNAVETISLIWLSRIPASKSKLVSSSNIEAFEAYTTSLVSIYRFKKDLITTEETAKIVNNLERCIRESDSPSYTSDLDSLTNLQSRVMRCLSMLRIDLEKATSLVLQMLGQLMSLPFQATMGEKKSGLTYIALSKAAMDLAQKIVHAESNWGDILSSDSLELILSNLERTIRLKYLWQRQGRSPPLWRKAVTTSVVILESAIPRLFEVEISQSDMEQYWKSIVGIFHNIAHAEKANDFNPPNSVINEDEVFDIEALEKLNTLIIPALGSTQIYDQARRMYCQSLLTASIIHNSEPEEISDLDTDPLGTLYSIRFGRTVDPEPSERSEMAYVCFRALLSLLQVQQSSPAQVRLAKAAAPYVILRTALPLKAYIADQPLRGKLPMPESQAYELVVTLRELRAVKCEPTAIPPTEKGVGQEGGHLVRLFPLLVGAARITTGPEEVKEELSKWLESLGHELGLPII